MTSKEHKFLNDDAKPTDNTSKFQAANNEEAYLFGTKYFSSFASRWNDTAFWAPVEPISFKVFDDNNVDIHTLIEKSKIREYDSLMWIDINRSRESMRKTKEDFLKSVNAVHGGLTDVIDSLKNDLKTRPKKKQ